MGALLVDDLSRPVDWCPDDGRVIYYRIIERRNVSFDPDTEESYYWGTDVDVLKFEMIKKTPKGAWIKTDSWKGRAFVLDGVGKRYAHTTLEAAEESFRRRKARQIKIYEAKIRSAKDALASLEKAVAKRKAA